MSREKAVLQMLKAWDGRGSHSGSCERGQKYFYLIIGRYNLLDRK